MQPQAVIQLLQQGQADEAISLCRRWLGQQPDNATAMALMGSACCASGNRAEGIRWLGQAVKRQPGLVQARVDLGRALRESGQPAAALPHLQAANRAAPNNPSILNEWSRALRDAGQFSEAVKLLRKACGLDKRHTGLRFNLANALRESGNSREAVSLYRELLKSDADNPALHNNLGLALKAGGQLDPAMEHFRRALALDASNPRVMSNLGVALGLNDQHKQAIESFLASLDRDPEQPEVFNHLADSYRESGDLDQAEVTLRKAVDRFGEDLHSYRNLAGLLEESNRVEDAIDVIDSGLGKVPNDAHLNILMARCERRSQSPEAACQRLARIDESKLDTELKRRKWIESGTALDRLGEHKEAWKQFRKANDLLRKTLPRLPDNRYDRWLESWQASPEGPPDYPPTSCNDPSSPIFLVGFPRSGTTLMDQFIDGHSGLRTMEETPALDGVIETMESSGHHYPQDIHSLDEATLQKLRDHYRAWVDGNIERMPGQRIVDRMPISMIHLPLIQLLWPGTPVIHINRHPADLCISAFMQDFRINALTAHFLTLKDTVSLCEQVLSVWQRWLERFPEQIHSIQYETLVENPEAELRPLLDFLGLDWEAGVLDHLETARSRKEIRTASYQQASQPLYTSSRYRWRHYRKQLEPMAERLTVLSRANDYEFE